MPCKGLAHSSGRAGRLRSIDLNPSLAGATIDHGPGPATGRSPLFLRAGRSLAAPDRASPGGHSAGQTREPAPPIGPGGWAASGAYLRGIALFNAGYYWEAHEVWEGLWHAHGRKGPTADVIKGLIKLAAAGVKVREGQPHGITTHAARAARLFESAAGRAGARQLGLDLDEWIAIARRIADDPPDDPGPPGAPVCACSPSGSNRPKTKMGIDHRAHRGHREKQRNRD